MKQSKNTILVPVNFTDSTEKALHIAVDIAKKWSAEIILLHVIDIPDFQDVEQELKEKFQRAVETTIKNKLQELAHQITGKNIKATITIAKGRTISEILKYSRENRVRLLVLGSKKYESMNETLEGSSTERIIRYANCPVLNVKEPIDVTQVKNIVLATDLKPTHTFITEELKNLQEISGATIHILKVNTKEDWTADVEIEKQMSEFNKVHQFSNFTFKISNAETIEEGIIHYSKNIKADMIAMSAHNLYRMPVTANNHFITERVLHSMPSLLWTCVPEFH